MKDKAHYSHADMEITTPPDEDNPGSWSNEDTGDTANSGVGPDTASSEKMEGWQHDRA